MVDKDLTCQVLCIGETEKWIRRSLLHLWIVVTGDLINDMKEVVKLNWLLRIATYPWLDNMGKR